jgi:hypothetical protein
MVNALSWIAHSQNLRRMCQDYKVDLVLSPPYAATFKLMDWHLIDTIVRDAYRCAHPPHLLDRSFMSRAGTAQCLFALHCIACDLMLLERR